MDFIKSPGREFPILVIRGGIGAGKTTTIRYCLDKVNLCVKCDDNCTNSEFLSFIDFSDEPEDTTSSAKLLAPAPKFFGDMIWNHIESQIGSDAYMLSDKEEVSDFWKWCNKNRKKIGIPKLRNVLDAFRNKLGSSKSIELFLKEREALHKDFLPKEKCFYWIYMLAFVFRKKRNYNCNVIVFDNVDHLNPHDQRNIFDFASKITSIFKCKIIFPMRPTTHSLNTAGARLSMYLDHYSPSIIDLLNNRLERYKKKENPIKAVTQSLESLSKRINNHYITKETIQATCGGCARYALRNIANFVCHPRLNISEAHTNPFKKENMNNDVFLEAYYCQGGAFLNTNFFPNLYNLVKVMEQGKLLVQIRILHYLFSMPNERDTLQGIRNTLSNFGYTDRLLSISLNELMDRNKQLIWSTGAYEYPEDISNSLMDSIQLTCIGKTYFSSILSDPHYIRECIFKIEKKRCEERHLWIPKVRQYMSNLVDFDLEEVEQFVEEVGVSVYKQMFGTQICISKIIWDKLAPRLEKLTKNTEIVIDPMFDQHVLMQFESLIEDWED